MAATIAADVPVTGTVGLAQPISVTTKKGEVAAVTVTSSTGEKAPGSFDAKTGLWTPSTLLKKSTDYTVAASIKDAQGRTGQVTRKLRTPATGVGTTGIYTVTPFRPGNVGNAQPVVLTFSQPVPASERKAVQNRFKVSDTSGVEGAWRWISPTRLDYRPKAFWPVGDKVSVTGSIQSMKIGNTWGAGTLKDTGFTVTSDLQAVYDPAKREITVTKGGKVIRTMKSDGGKKGFESLSGALVVLDKSKSVRMRSCSVGISCNPSAPEFYDEEIANAVQLTPSGTYVHSAPWDKQLGKVDSSHGCLHLSATDAAWFYDQVIPGNLVTLKGSTNPVEVTNGETDWNLTWEQWTAPTA